MAVSLRKAGCWNGGVSQSKFTLPLTLPYTGTSKPPREEHQSNGVMTSPNFGKGPYPNNLHFEQTIQVDKGKTIKIDFTDFRIERCPYGSCDWVEINEGDGSRLADIRRTASFKEEDILAEDIVSKTDRVTVLFHTDEAANDDDVVGWRLVWGELKMQGPLISSIN